jgi:iron complex outermembrane receptor protein
MQKYWMSGAAVGVLLMSLAPAVADTVSEDAAGLETVTITGFRKSLDEARTLKKESAIISDAIVAEDMAKFPDLNLAEALQRLPGVSINREAGEGRRITLRGLGPDYTRVQLNGMEVLGNNDSAMDSRGQRSRDRAFDFNLFASELFSKAEVEKTYQASQSEGGMAGTVDLYTGKPLNNPEGFKLAASLKAGTNTYTADFQPRGAALFGYNWNNKFGILVSLAYSKRKTEEQGYDTYSPSVYSTKDMNKYVANGLDLSALSATDQAMVMSGKLTWPTGNRLSVWEAKQERIGLTVSMEWRPTESFSLALDGVKGRFHTNRDEYHLATRTHASSTVLGQNYVQWGQTLPAPTINALTWDDTGYVTSVDVSNTVYASEHRRENNTTNFDQLVLSGTWKPLERLTLSGHVGMESSTYKTPRDDKAYFQVAGGMKTQLKEDYGHNTYDWDTTDISRYRLRELYFRQFDNGTSFYEGVFNAAYDLNDSITVRAGYTRRRYKTHGTEAYNDSYLRNSFKTGVLVNGHDDKVNAYASVYRGHNDLQWVTADWGKLLAYYNVQHTMTTDTGQPTTDIENTFAIVEETDAGYVQVDWKTELIGRPLRGNIGLRAYGTDEDSSGLVGNAMGGLATQSLKSSYNGLLPTFNAAWELSDTFQLRAAASKNINRPGLSSLAMTGSVSRNPEKTTVSSGNPYLKPYMSNNYDLSAEWYFGRVGMLAVGVFHKDIKNLVVTRTDLNVPYSATGLPLSLGATEYDYIPTLTPTTPVDYQHPVNVATAGISGLELAGQTDFFFLPEPLDHLGIVANATFISSNSVQNNSDGPIVGLSPTNANATLYYEEDDWGVRASANHRSGYLDGRYDGINVTSYDGFKATTYIDAAAFYKLNDNIRFTFDAINLTNQREVQYNTVYKRLHNATQSGSTFFVGVDFQY